jgi:hypothetical protein
MKTNKKNINTSKPIYLGVIWNYVLNSVPWKFYFLFKINYFFIFLNRFDVLILKIIFKK